MTDLTPHPWHWDEDGQLIGDGGFLIIGASLNKNGSAYVSVSEEDQSAIATTPELVEALKQVRTDYHKVHTAYEEAVIDLGGNTILSKEIARVVIDRIDAAIAKATGGTA